MTLGSVTLDRADVKSPRSAQPDPTLQREMYLQAIAYGLWPVLFNAQQAREDELVDRISQLRQDVLHRLRQFREGK